MYIQADNFRDISDCFQGFFTRRGGVSSGLYAELNCGGRDVVEPAAVVDENRRRVAAAAGVPAHALLSTRQIHSAIVSTITRPWTFDERPEGDAMVTAVPHIALGVLTADCAPVVFIDPVARVIGAAHSGWKGTLAGVLEATVAAMAALGAQPGRIYAAIGPTLAQASYEVSQTFRATFLRDDPRYERYFMTGADAEHWNFDLPSLVEDRLRALGLASCSRSPHDTYRDESDYYSYRRSVHRQEPDYGRQISVIALLD